MRVTQWQYLNTEVIPTAALDSDDYADCIYDAEVRVKGKLTTGGDGWNEPRYGDVSHSEHGIEVDVNGVTYTAEEFEKLFTVIKVAKGSKIYPISLDSFIVNSYNDFDFEDYDDGGY